MNFGFNGFTAKRQLQEGNHTLVITNIEAITVNASTGEVLPEGGYIRVTGTTTEGIEWNDALMNENSKQYFLNNIKKQVDPEGKDWDEEKINEQLSNIITEKTELEVAIVKNISIKDGKTYYNKAYYHVTEQVDIDLDEKEIDNAEF